MLGNNKTYSETTNSKRQVQNLGCGNTGMAYVHTRYTHMHEKPRGFGSIFMVIRPIPSYLSCLCSAGTR